MRPLLILFLASPLAAQGEWLPPFVEPEIEHYNARIQAGAGYDTNPYRAPESDASAFLDARADAVRMWESEPFALHADWRSGLRWPLSEPDAATWQLIARARGEVRSAETGTRVRAGFALAVAWERRRVYDIFDLPTIQQGLQLAGAEGRLDFSLLASPFGLSATLWGGHHAFSSEDTPRSYDPADSVFPGLGLPIPPLRPLHYSSIGGTFWLELCFADVIEVGPYFWVEGRYFAEQRPIGAFGLPDTGRMSLLRIEYGSRVQVVASEKFKFTGGWFIKQGGGGGSGDAGKDALTFFSYGYRVAAAVNFEVVSASATFEACGRDSTVGSEFQQTSQSYVDLKLEVRGRPLQWLEVGAEWRLYGWGVDEPEIGYDGWEAQVFVAARF